MYSSTKTKVHKLPAGEFFDVSQSVNHFPVGVYFIRKYGTPACTLDINTDIDKSIITFLEENGELIYEYTSIPTNAPSSGIFDINSYWDESEVTQTKLFFYKDNVLHLQRTCSRKVKQEDINYAGTFYYPTGYECVANELERFFIKEPLKNVIYTIMRDEHGGTRFDPFEVSIPEGYDIDKCYEPDFKPVHENIVNSLNKNESGLYLFHGDPGTGKTTYIKYLSSLVKRDFIYVPTGFLDYIADPSFLPALVHKKQSILIIEDAEKALLAREPGDNSSSLVSTILNLTDGIMANVFQLSIIATYNSPRASIDKALLRKGRLKAEYRFDKLSVEVAQSIVNGFKPDFKVKEPMSLAEIYNIDQPTNITDKELVEEKRMGFF